MVTALLGDEDRLVRTHAVFAASGWDQFARQLRAMNETETDPWVRILLEQAAEDEQWRRQTMEIEQQATDEPAVLMISASRPGTEWTDDSGLWTTRWRTRAERTLQMWGADPAAVGDSGDAVVPPF